MGGCAVFLPENVISCLLNQLLAICAKAADIGTDEAIRLSCCCWSWMGGFAYPDAIGVAVAELMCCQLCPSLWLVADAICDAMCADCSCWLVVGLVVGWSVGWLVEKLEWR